MGRGVQKVWHVFRFRERFELADDQRYDRRRPLVYSRDYVTANDDESASYLRQMDALSRRQNGLELEGAWSRIRRAASARSREFRGFLLTADNRPASDAEIGRTVLFCEPRRAARILKTLAELGLLEQARCPIFDESRNDVTPKKSRQTPANKAHREKRTSGRRKSVSRKTAEHSGSLYARARVQEHKRVNGKVKAKKKRNPESAKSKAKPRATEGETPCPPAPRQTVNPKANPQESAAGAKQGLSSFPPPTATRGGSPAVLGSVVPGVLAKIGAREKWTDEEAVTFGYEVFGLIWPGEDPEGDFAKAERGAFTAWLHGQGPAGSRQAAIEKGLKIARHVGRNRKSYRRPGAVWREILDGKTNATTKARAC